MVKTRIQRFQSSQMSSKTTTSSESGDDRLEIVTREPVHVKSSDEGTDSEETQEDTNKDWDYSAVVFKVPFRGADRLLLDLFKVAVSDFDKDADLDVLGHPLLNLIYYMLVERIPSALVLFILRKLPPKRVSDQYHPIR